MLVFDCRCLRVLRVTAKLHTITNGTNKDSGGGKYCSVLYMIPYEITDKNAYIFSTDGITKEQGAYKYEDPCLLHGCFKPIRFLVV